MFKITQRMRYDEQEKGIYRDRNMRDRAIAKAPKPAHKCPFGFDNMKPGDAFYIEFEAGKEQSMRTMLHQNARLAGIWIETHVHLRNAKTTCFYVRHDGKRL